MDATRPRNLPRGFKRLATGKVIKLGAERRDRGYCERCGLVMDDAEPMGAHPEWRHKATGRCPNDGESFSPGTEHARRAKVVPFRGNR